MWLRDPPHRSLGLRGHKIKWEASCMHALWPDSGSLWLHKFGLHESSTWLLRRWVTQQKKKNFTQMKSLDGKQLLLIFLLQSNDWKTQPCTPPAVARSGTIILFTGWIATLMGWTGWNVPKIWPAGGGGVLENSTKAEKKQVPRPHWPTFRKSHKRWLQL